MYPYALQYLQSLPKPTTPIPSIAYLYGNAIKQAPHIQAGFIYKARQENNANRDAYQTATMYPIFNRPAPSDNRHSNIKYQQVYQQQKTVSHPKVKQQYTPFSASNKIPGDWQPIAFSKPNGYIKGQVYNDYLR